MTPNSLPAAHSRAKSKKTMLVSALLVIFTMILAACGSSGQNNNPGSTTKHILTVAAQSSDFSQAGLNPFNGHPDVGVQGLIYETLYFVNVNGGNFTPMLATAYSWNSDNTQLTFTIRQGVKWNDGKPFDANDVAFTFNLMKQYAAADANGVWSYLSSVTAPSATTVLMTFTKAYPPELVTIAGHVFIVPQHVFASVGDPTKFLTSNPVGTGPFTVSKYEANLAVYVKNSSYWQASSVKVDEVHFPEYKDNSTLQLALPQGTIDWAGYFSPTLNQDFVQKDMQHNHLFMDAINLYSICVNQKDPVVGGAAGLPIRLALSSAIDRTQIAQQATAGLEPPGSVTGLVLPTAQSWLAPQYANLSTGADVATAQKDLTGAGWTLGSDGYFQKNGKDLTLTLRSVDTYSDWNAAAQLIQSEAKAVGIKINNVTVAENNYYTLRADGKFDYQMMFCGMVGGPTPYYLYNNYLNSSLIGQGKTNFVAWNDPKTDQYLTQYASTSDQSVQMQAIQGIEQVFVQNQPFIPLWTGADYDEYTTRHFTGWPTTTNPYSSGSPNTAPDIEQVILHLTPTS
jgi:peptide/nickel transport system substrate-binding protein